MIDYNKPWHVLNVNMDNALNPEFDAEKFRAQTDQAGKSFGIWSFRDTDMLNILNKEWLDYLLSKGIEVNSFMMFYRDAHFLHPEAHVDILWHSNLPNIFSINWVITPNDDSYMTWYDVPYETGTTELTPVNTKYVYWKMEDVQDKEIARYTIGDKLTMVRTGIAHNVIVNSQPRWVISLRSKVVGNPNYSDWKSAVDYYANDLKLITI